MSDEGTAPEQSATGLAGFVLENRSWMQFASLLMILYAVWAVIEVFSNTFFLASNRSPSSKQAWRPTSTPTTFSATTAGGSWPPGPSSVCLDCSLNTFTAEHPWLTRPWRLLPP